MIRTLEEQIEYYNTRWSSFSYANGLELERCTAILSHVIETGLVYPRVCDLGCGAGWLSGVLGCFGPTFGMDLSDAAMRSAAERFPYVQFHARDVFQWNSPKEHFDVVVSQEVLEHVGDQAGYLSIAHAILRPGGYLILTTPNARTMNAMEESRRKSWSDQPLENWVTSAQLRSLLLRAGFRDICISTIILGPGSSGIYRVINSCKLQKLAFLFGIGGIWKRASLRAGYGLHFVIRGRKPG